MRRSTSIRLAILVVLATLAGCAVPIGKEPADQLLASEAMIRELRETRPAFMALAPDEKSAVHLWLLANCAVDEDDRLTQLVKRGPRMEAALIEAFRMGPPTAFLSEMTATRRSDYKAIKERLDAEDRELFGPELRQRLTAVSEGAYVNAGIERTIVNYRIAALNGLASIGSDTSIAWLERTALTLKDPELRDAAARTLATARDRPRR